MSYQDGLRQANAAMDPLAALRAPANVLLGIGEPARTALAGLGIETIFDLATSPLFGLARQVGLAALGRGPAALSRFEAVPGGASGDDGPTNLRDFVGAPLTAIRSLSAADAATLSAALQVETVGDLGRWPPFVAALMVLEAAGGGEPVEDEAGAELQPKFGEFPTERRYYSTLVIDHVKADGAVDLAAAGPVDISPALDADFGFSAPAVGARLTFEQSWYAHGVTLGNLLHSVALAPGESTRLAVVDWSRQTSASATEAISESEALTSQTTHNRAVSEVQQAVATEVQSGFSHAESTATTEEYGGGGGFSLGPLTLGGSASTATTTTSADSYSTSVGSRDLAASMSQKVMDATQQASSSIRNRRASIVKEISETEHESVSTRILANYNHMHALTVQYYEVVEVYRVSVRLHEVERRLFVPMKLTDFDDRTIARYQGALARAALTRRARELLSTELGTVRITATAPMRPFRFDRADVATTRAMARMRTGASAGAPEATAEIPDAFSAAEVERASRIFAGAVLAAGGTSLLLPKDATLQGVSTAVTDGPRITGVAVRRVGGAETQLTQTSIGWRVPGGVPLDELSEVVAVTDTGAAKTRGAATLELGYRGAVIPVTLPIELAAGGAGVFARAQAGETGPELVEHLRANRLHYNQAIWRSLDASTVALLLSKFTFEGQPVADLIDPSPVQAAGNYLVFRMPGFVARAGLAEREDDATTPEGQARQAWREWRERRGLTFDADTRQDQLVPVPTGGVFAEAVLGRSNAAEKLDATRFWNWQDSPIPLQPPEIAAISMGSRAQGVDVTPGQLGQPVLNIVNPTSLPDPTGLGAMLGALQNGSMFRDMSGLAATIGLAQASGENATSAAADAGKLAAANLAVAAQKEIEQARIAAQVAMAMMGNPAAMQGTPKNISEMGAMLNTADKRDQAKAAGGAAAAGGGGSGAAGAGDAGAGGGVDDGLEGGDDVMPGVAPALGDGGFGDTAMSRALFGQLASPAVLGAPKRTQPKPPAKPKPALKTDEHYLIAGFDPPAAWQSPAAEVSDLAAQTWRPTSADFQALARKVCVAGNIRVTDTVRRFVNSIAFPSIRRHNFYGYGLLPNPYIIGLAGTVQPLGGTANNSLDGQALDMNVLGALIQHAQANPQSEAALLFKEARESHHPEAQLWFYLAEFAPMPDALAQLIASTFAIKVFAFPEPVWFLPEFTAPDTIKDRGFIGFGPGPQRSSAQATRTEDPYAFDAKAKRFDP